MRLLAFQFALSLFALTALASEGPNLQQVAWTLSSLEVGFTTVEKNSLSHPFSPNHDSFNDADAERVSTELKRVFQNLETFSHQEMTEEKADELFSLAIQSFNLSKRLTLYFVRSYQSSVLGNIKTNPFQNLKLVLNRKLGLKLIGKFPLTARHLDENRIEFSISAYEKELFETGALLRETSTEESYAKTIQFLTLRQTLANRHSLNRYLPSPLLEHASTCGNEFLTFQTEPKKSLYSTEIYTEYSNIDRFIELQKLMQEASDQTLNSFTLTRSQLESIFFVGALRSTLFKDQVDNFYSPLRLQETKAEASKIVFENLVFNWKNTNYAVLSGSSLIKDNLSSSEIIRRASAVSYLKQKEILLYQLLKTLEYGLQLKLSDAERLSAKTAWENEIDRKRSLFEKGFQEKLKPVFSKLESPSHLSAALKERLESKTKSLLEMSTYARTAVRVLNQKDAAKEKLLVRNFSIFRDLFAVYLQSDPFMIKSLKAYPELAQDLGQFVVESEERFYRSLSPGRSLSDSESADLLAKILENQAKFLLLKYAGLTDPERPTTYPETIEENLATIHGDGAMVPRAKPVYYRSQTLEFALAIFHLDSTSIKKRRDEKKLIQGIDLVSTTRSQRILAKLERDSAYFAEPFLKIRFQEHTLLEHLSQSENSVGLVRTAIAAAAKGSVGKLEEFCRGNYRNPEKDVSYQNLFRSVPTLRASFSQTSPILAKIDSSLAKKTRTSSEKIYQDIIQPVSMIVGLIFFANMATGWIGLPLLPSFAALFAVANFTVFVPLTAVNFVFRTQVDYFEKPAQLAYLEDFTGANSFTAAAQDGENDSTLTSWKPVEIEKKKVITNQILSGVFSIMDIFYLGNTVRTYGQLPRALETLKRSSFYYDAVYPMKQAFTRIQSQTLPQVFSATSKKLEKLRFVKSMNLNKVAQVKATSEEVFYKNALYLLSESKIPAPALALEVEKSLQQFSEIAEIRKAFRNETELKSLILSKNAEVLSQLPKSMIQASAAGEKELSEFFKAYGGSFQSINEANLVALEEMQKVLTSLSQKAKSATSMKALASQLSELEWIALSELAEGQLSATGKVWKNSRPFFKELGKDGGFFYDEIFNSSRKEFVDFKLSSADLRPKAVDTEKFYTYSPFTDANGKRAFRDADFKIYTNLDDAHSIREDFSNYFDFSKNYFALPLEKVNSTFRSAKQSAMLE